MAERDLTPRLRTRMRGVERAVGLFAFVAFLILAAGFGYYVHHTAARKGWFLTKVRCHTFLRNAEGIRVGDPVKMFGFAAGEITVVQAMPPFSELGNVYVEFVVQGENIGYIWNDSKARVSTADFLGKRSFELIPGGNSGSTNLHASFLFDKKGRVTSVWSQNHWYAPNEPGKYADYTHASKGYTLFPDESPALGERLDRMASKIEAGLPGILALTNSITETLSNAASLTRQIEGAVLAAKPSLSNLEAITTRLRDPRGSLGEWLIPTNLHAQAGQTFTNVNLTLLGAQNTLSNVDAEFAKLSVSLALSLEHLAGLTGNLNSQVQRNTNMLSEISEAVRNTDAFVQGLRNHWMLRSAFKGKTNAAGEPGASAPKRKLP